DQRLWPAVRPQGQIAQPTVWHDAGVEDIRLSGAGGCTPRVHHIHRRAQGSAEGVTGAYLAGVDDPTRLYPVQRQPPGSGCREIAIDVDDQVGVISRINGD